MWFLVSAALAWSHRGHVWEDAQLPLRVCAEPGFEVPLDLAIRSWTEGTGRRWFELDCDAPDIEVTRDPDGSGPLSRFVLSPSQWTVGDCDYVTISEGRVAIRFSGAVDWTGPVGTIVGDCDGVALQAQILERYLGLALGLDSSAEPSAMEAFGECTGLGATVDDRAGLAALYGAPRMCEAPEPTSEPEAVRGCSAVGGPGTRVWSWLSRRR